MAKSEGRTIVQRNRVNPARHRKRKRDASITSRLDLLSDDHLVNVLQQASMKPHLERWEHYFPPETRMTLLRYGGPLADAVRSNVRSLELVELIEEDEKEEKDPKGLRFRHSLSRNRDIAKELVSVLGPTLPKVFLKVPWLPKRFDDGIVKRGSALKNLSMTLGAGYRELHSFVVKRCGSTLKTLELSAEHLQEEDVMAVARQSKGLHRFMLESRKLRTSLSPLWISLASSLRDLELGCLEEYCHAAIGELGVHCKLITKLSLFWFGVKMENLVSFIVGYSTGLHVLNLDAVALA